MYYLPQEDEKTVKFERRWSDSLLFEQCLWWWFSLGPVWCERMAPHRACHHDTVMAARWGSVRTIRACPRSTTECVVVERCATHAAGLSKRVVWLHRWYKKKHFIALDTLGYGPLNAFSDRCRWFLEWFFGTARYKTEFIVSELCRYYSVMLIRDSIKKHLIIKFPVQMHAVMMKNCWIEK